MIMCGDANCQHVKFDPNSKKTLGEVEQAQLWADIKKTREKMTERIAFLTELGLDDINIASDDLIIKQEAMTKSLWERFRKL
jgi:hypothetical protein